MILLAIVLRTGFYRWHVSLGHCRIASSQARGLSWLSWLDLAGRMRASLGIPRRKAAGHFDGRDGIRISGRSQSAAEAEDLADPTKQDTSGKPCRYCKRARGDTNPYKVGPLAKALSLPFKSPKPLCCAPCRSADVGRLFLFAKTFVAAPRTAYQTY